VVVQGDQAFQFEVREIMPNMKRREVVAVGLLAIVVNVSAFGQYDHGTAVLALPTGNQILFAADSARSHEGQTTYDACKIAEVDNKTIFIMAGLVAVLGRTSFTDQAVEMLRENNPRTREALRSIAERWNKLVIADIASTIRHPKMLRAASDLSPVEAIFATVDDEGKVIFLTSRFDIVYDPRPPDLTSSIPSYIQGLQISDGISPGVMGSHPFGLRLGESGLDDLRKQNNEWSRKNAAVLKEIDQPGTVMQKKAVAETFMKIVAPTSRQPDGSFAVGGDTDSILLGPTGATWLSRKGKCPAVRESERTPNAAKF